MAYNASDDATRAISARVLESLHVPRLAALSFEMQQRAEAGAHACSGSGMASRLMKARHSIATSATASVMDAALVCEVCAAIVQAECNEEHLQPDDAPRFARAALQHSDSSGLLQLEAGRAAAAAGGLWRLLQLHAWRGHLMQALLSVYGESGDKEVCTKQLTWLLPLTEVMPVRFACWVALVTGRGPEACEQMVGGLSAGGEDVWGSTERVRSLASDPVAKVPDYGPVAEQALQAAQGSDHLLKAVLQGATFKALWDWSVSACDQLLQELHAACDVQMGACNQPGQGEQEAKAGGHDLVAAVAAIRMEAGIT